jgi:hypothetical protein
MRRSRARLLASALVLGTAGLASATVALGVRDASPARGRPIVAAGGSDDGGVVVPPEDMTMGPGSDAPIDDDSGPGGGSDAGPMDSQQLPSIEIVEPTITLSGGPPTGTATIITNTGGGLGSATVGSPNDVFRLTECGLSTCAYGSPALPYSLGITCTPTTVPEMGMLTVFEASGGLGDTAMVICPATTPGPILSVSPDNLAFGSVPVGTTPSQQIFIANAGGSTLGQIVISFGASANAAHWQASACTSSAPCSVGAGSSFPVDITFAPTTHGVKDVTLTVTSNGGTDTVALTGTGAGGVMSVRTPPAPMHVLDIGTIPRGQPAMRNIELDNLGNGPYTATPTMPTAPYSIAPGPHVVPGGMTRPIAVTCQSATATATDNPQTVTITSDAYLGSPATVQLRCKIADTLLQISPTTFDYGEVRIGTPEPEIPITLTNPPTSGLPVQITAFDLREHRPGLTLTKPATPFSIAPGAMQTAALRLSTAAETDLNGEYLDLTVDGTQLQFPVTGKVVTPHSRIVPPNQLDLGTACTGSNVMGNVMLINDGTATLQVQPPEMDQSFIASAMGVPGPLAAGNSITAQVAPGMAASGPIHGMLTWRDDVPSEHVIRVVLDYVATGTALSPRGLDFGVVEVDMPGGAQQIKLQNCDMTPSRVKLESLKTKQGTLAAWILEPRVGYTKELGGREQQSITVSFEPPARGRYEADLTVTTASGKQIVHLVGDATGRDFDATSFYACACSGPSAPQRGWPVLVAIVLVIVRRRRRVFSSSR